MLAMTLWDAETANDPSLLAIAHTIAGAIVLDDDGRVRATAGALPPHCPRPTHLTTGCCPAVSQASLTPSTTLILLSGT